MDCTRDKSDGNIKGGKMIKLVIPSEKYLSMYLEYCRDSFNKVDRVVPHDPTKFFYWKDSIISNYHIQSLNDKIVNYWAIEDEKLVGVVVIRINLTPSTINDGGNIDFVVNSKLQNKGYGTLLLSQGLEKAKRHGIVRALLTCEDSNIKAIKVIEKCNGKLENKVISSNLDKQQLIRRYWINL